MLPDRISNLGHLTYESGALSIALRSPARLPYKLWSIHEGKNLLPSEQIPSIMRRPHCEKTCPPGKRTGCH